MYTQGVPINDRQGAKTAKHRNNLIAVDRPVCISRLVTPIPGFSLCHVCFLFQFGNTVLNKSGGVHQ